jgi:hypothetical protein
MSQDPRLNPYQVPDLEAARHEFRGQRETARQAVKGPAIGLICVAALSLFMGLGCMALDAVMLGSGAANLGDPQFHMYQLVVRTVWGLIICANCGFSIWAGISMQRLQQHQLCWLAGILACIPAISPCFCLGIPFGVWAIIVLNRSEVYDAFDAS